MKKENRLRAIVLLFGLGICGFSLAAEPAINPQVSASVAAILFAGTFFGLVSLGMGPDMLRDPRPDVMPVLPEGQVYVRPFSLGKVQMAWWFAIVVGSYLYVWARTGAVPELSPALLSLAGVAGATGAVSSAIGTTQQTQYPAHVGFFRDLLTDRDGVTLHRFQMLSMTVILGSVFIVRVLATAALPPDFDATTLGLMGISAGTYLGFKIPEKQ